MDSKKDLTDLASDYTEVGIDALLDEAKEFLPVLEGVSSDIPIVRSAVAVIKAPRNISDYLLGRKVNEFLYASNLTRERIEKLKAELQDKYGDRLWERIIYAINSHDNVEKSKITGKLFAALIDDELTYHEFIDLVHATNVLNLALLPELRLFYTLSDNSQEGGYKTLFVTLGLLRLDESTMGTIGGGAPFYVMTSLGWKYLGIVYDHGETCVSNVGLGEGDLVPVVLDTGATSSQAFPLTVIIERGLRYRVVELYAINQRGEIYCDHDGNPLPIASRLPTIDDETYASIPDQLASENDLSPMYGTRIFSSRWNPEKKVVHARSVMVLEDLPGFSKNIVSLWRKWEEVPIDQITEVVIDKREYLNDLITDIDNHSDRYGNLSLDKTLPAYEGNNT